MMIKCPGQPLQKKEVFGLKPGSTLVPFMAQYFLNVAGRPSPREFHGRSFPRLIKALFVLTETDVNCHTEWPPTWRYNKGGWSWMSWNPARSGSTTNWPATTWINICAHFGPQPGYQLFASRAALEFFDLWSAKMRLPLRSIAMLTLKRRIKNPIIWNIQQGFCPENIDPSGPLNYAGLSATLKT